MVMKVAKDDFHLGQVFPHGSFQAGQSQRLQADFRMVEIFHRGLYEDDFHFDSLLPAYSTKEAKVALAEPVFLSEWDGRETNQAVT